MNLLSPLCACPLRLLLISWLAADTLILAASGESFLSLDFVRAVPLGLFFCLWALSLGALLFTCARLPRLKGFLLSPLPCLALYLLVLFLKGTSLL